MISMEEQSVFQPSETETYPVEDCLIGWFLVMPRVGLKVVYK